MADRVIEEHVHTTDGGGNGAMTAMVIVLFMVLLLVVLYFTGVFGRWFGRDTKHEIDVNINKPGVILRIA
jgi:hypothetical protein